MMMPMSDNLNSDNNNNNNNNNNGGTPSKHKNQQSFFPPHNKNAPSKRSNTSSSSSSSSSSSHWKTLRWILLGFGVGAATTALIQSVNLPSIRVELEYGDAPNLNHEHSMRLSRRKNNNNNNNNKRRNKQDSGEDDDDNDDDKLLNNEHDSNDRQVKKERQEIAKELHQEGLVDEAQELLLKKAGPPKIASSSSSIVTPAKAGKQQQQQQPGIQLVAGEMLVEDDDPDFSNPGPVPSLDKEEAFAACILIKDDNHWLTEWLAYHYHTMPLRYLIVAVDPGSKTTPRPILKRWSDAKLMNIFVWNDTKFMPTKIKAKAAAFDNNTELMYHRVRQNNFYFKCMRTFKQRNRAWLMLVDTDEYIVTNYASGLYHNLTKRIPIQEPGNVLKFIKQHHGMTGENHTCSYMPRYMFGVQESANEVVQRHLPANSGLDGHDFVTQRFVYRNSRRMYVLSYCVCVCVCACDFRFH